MTPNQIRWAREHDWFLDELDDGHVLVREDWTAPDGTVHPDYCIFDDFTQLRRWAGY